MPLTIKGQFYDIEVIVGHRYNDTATTQVEVLQINLPDDVMHPGEIYVKELSLNCHGWYNAGIIGAKWRDAEVT